MFQKTFQNIKIDKFGVEKMIENSDHARVHMRLSHTVELKFSNNVLYFL